MLPQHLLAQHNFARARIDDGSHEDASAAISDFHALPRLQPQHLVQPLGVVRSKQHRTVDRQLRGRGGKKESKDVRHQRRLPGGTAPLDLAHEQSRAPTIQHVLCHERPTVVVDGVLDPQTTDDDPVR